MRSNHCNCSNVKVKVTASSHRWSSWVTKAAWNSWRQANQQLYFGYSAYSDWSRSKLWLASAGCDGSGCLSWQQPRHFLLAPRAVDHRWATKSVRQTRGHSSYWPGLLTGRCSRSCLVCSSAAADQHNSQCFAAIVTTLSDSNPFWTFARSLNYCSLISCPDPSETKALNY